MKQDFYKPKKVVYMTEHKKWGDSEKAKLYTGLQTLGVGAWREMRSTLGLAEWDETALRIKASRLLGSQSLARYAGWKGDRAAVDAERTKNEKLGKALGCWKAGVLVENDEGAVGKALAAAAAGAGAAAAAGAEADLGS